MLVQITFRTVSVVRKFCKFLVVRILGHVTIGQRGRGRPPFGPWRRFIRRRGGECSYARRWRAEKSGFSKVFRPTPYATLAQPTPRWRRLLGQGHPIPDCARGRWRRLKPTPNPSLAPRAHTDMPRARGVAGQPSSPSPPSPLPRLVLPTFFVIFLFV